MCMNRVSHKIGQAYSHIFAFASQERHKSRASLLVTRVPSAVHAQHGCNVFIAGVRPFLLASSSKKNFFSIFPDKK